MVDPSSWTVDPIVSGENRAVDPIGLQWTDGILPLSMQRGGAGNSKPGLPRSTRTSSSVLAEKEGSNEEVHRARCACDGGSQHHGDNCSSESGSGQHRQAGLPGVWTGC